MELKSQNYITLLMIILSVEFSVEKLLKILVRESQIATDWFKENNMIINAGKFQAIIMKQNSDMCNQYTLNIKGNEVIKPLQKKSVKLLNINIDNKSFCDEHISILCQ